MGISQSSQAWKSQFQQIYDQNSANIRKIKHRKTQQKYELLSLYASDDESTVLSKLVKRQNIKSKYLQDIHSCQHVKPQNYCGDKKRYDIIFKQSSPTLQNHLNYRRIKNQRFSNEEILYVIHNIALALKDIRDMGEDYGNVRFSNILVNDEVKLKDIILISEEDHHFENMTEKNKKIKKIKGFPSPQKLYTYFDSLTHFEEFTADLFSLGIVALQLYFPNQNMSTLYIWPNQTYQNIRINLNRLNNFIELIAERQIRKIICILTSESANERVQVYSRLKDLKIQEYKIQMLKINPFAIYEQSNHSRGEILRQTQISKANIIALSQQTINKQVSTNIRQIQVPKPSNFISAPLKNQRVFSNTPNKPIYQQFNIYSHDIHGSLNQGNSTNNPMSLQSQIHKTKTPINFNIYSNNQSTLKTDILRSRQNGPAYPYLSTPSPSIQLKIPSFSQYLTSDSSNINYKLSSESLLRFNEAAKAKDITHIQNRIVNNIDSSKQPKDKNAALIKNRYVDRYEITTKYSNESVQKNTLIPSITEQAHKRPTSELMKNYYAYVYHNKSNVSLYHQPTQKITLISVLEQNQQKPNSSTQVLQAQNQIKNIAEYDQNKNSNISHRSNNYNIIENYQTGALYEGKKTNGMRNGHGKILYKEGSHYIGEWKDNKMEGFGHLYYPSGNKAYQGHWKDDQFHGKGIVYNDQPVNLDTPFDYTNFTNLKQQWVKYQGEFINDAKEGNGRLTLTNGEMYQGQFSKDFVHGEGAFTKMDGSVIKGFWTQSLLTIQKI